MSEAEETLGQEMIRRLLKDQQDEITSHHLYRMIENHIKDQKNREIIRKMGDDELNHYNTLEAITRTQLKPQRMKIFFYYWIIKILGLTFGIKLLEKGEDQARKAYDSKKSSFKVLEDIMKDEARHENELIRMIDEERLNYMGAVVLGLNDALVELTGALAGYTFAFQNTRLIALTGLITGISASFSMAASEYLASRHEEDQNAVKSAAYTGMAYIFTVVFLILPFLLLGNPFVSLATSLVVAVVIIFVFNYYISVAKDLDFRRRFLEMAMISLGVAGISFLIGIAVKQFIGIEL